MEAASYLFLLVATAMKYGASYKTGVTLLGPVHGSALSLVFPYGVEFLSCPRSDDAGCSPARWIPS